MNKRAQLGIIEFKFLLIGLAIGIILTIVYASLCNSGIVPKIPFVCK